jgi:Spy/CpxP family protein refolding chaperone
MEQSARTRLVTVVILAVVFGSGVMLGLAADSGLSAAPTSEAGTAVSADERAVEGGAATDADAEASDDDGDAPAARRYTYHEVEPNEEQLARIEVIVAEWRADREAFDADSRSRWEEGRRELVLATREQIKAVLTPEQAAEYQRLLDEWEAERAAERENEDDRN